MSGKDYIEIMSDIIGIDITVKCRKKEVVWGRNMVAYQLRRDGLSLHDVGNILGLDHSTVVHCEQNVTNMLQNPLMYFEEMRIWKRFKDTLYSQQKNYNYVQQNQEVVAV